MTPQIETDDDLFNRLRLASHEIGIAAEILRPHIDLIGRFQSAERVSDNIDDLLRDLIAGAGAFVAMVDAASLRAEIWPAQLTESLAEILGMPNFRCAPYAHLFRAAGHDIAPRAEAEQAFVLHRLVGFALAHGAEWRKAARLDLEAAQRTILEKRDREQEI